jgi:peptide/nickel transport system substrate-binding protein
LVLLQSELGSLMYEQCNVDFLFFDDPSQRAPADLTSARLLSTYWLGFNTTKVPLKLREAIAHAVDRQALFAGLSGLIPNPRVAKAFLPPEMPGAVPDSDPRLAQFPGTDLVKAKALLAEAGPLPAELTLLVRGTGSFLPETALAEGLRRQLEPLGLKLKIVTTSNFSNDVKEADGTLRYDLFLKRTGADYAHPHTLLTPFQAGGNHYTDWQKLDGGAAIAKFEKLLAAGAAEADDAKRTQLYLDAQQVLLTEQVAVVPLYFPNRSFRKRAWLTGLSVDPFNFLTFRAMRVDAAPVARTP